MKLISRNVRGLGNDRVFRVLKELKQDNCLDIMFLLETKSNHARLEKLRIQLGFYGKLVVYVYCGPIQ